MLESLEVIIAVNQAVGRGTMYPATGARVGVALLASAANGYNGPSGVFEELALYCQAAGISAFRFKLCAPQSFAPTILDLGAVVAAMSERGVERLVLVVEATTPRSAAFAPIAYRSIAGLAGVVVGVATIITPGPEDSPALPNHFPPELSFLFRLARSQSDASSFLREVVRPGGLSELLLSPGHPRQKRSTATAVVTPIFTWARRALLATEPSPLTEPSSVFVSEEQRCGGQVTLEQGPLRLEELAEYPTSHPLDGGAISTYGEVCAWLTGEWQRILWEQAQRKPRQPNLSEPPASPGTAMTPVRALFRQYANKQAYLDDTARDEWRATYLRASRMVVELTNVRSTLAHHSA